MRTIAILPGRFQPFGKHHAATFLWVQKQFGAENSFIATSDLVDPFKNPFSFKEKKAIISAYGFKNVIQVRDPYKAVEVTKKFNSETTAVVFVVGQKDLDRLREGGYFVKYPGPDKPLLPYSEQGYIMVAPHISLNVPGYGEMSGTQIRTALGDQSLSIAEKKKLFKGIFGWYAPNLAKLIFKVLGDMKKSEMNEDRLPGGRGDALIAADVDPNELKMGIAHEMEHTRDKRIATEIALDHLAEDPKYYTHLKNAGIKENVKLFSPEWWQSQILNEGGAAGHMMHVFDLPNVKTGKDMLRVYTDVVKSLQQKPGAVKIDGVNTTIKVVNKDNKLQFALDRGSMNPIDVEGITINDLGKRFSEGHGMLTIGKKVLTAFNSCLPAIKGELKSLGMLSDPTILLNVETVIGDASGKTNVIEYKENFFVIHSVLKSKQATPKRRSQSEIPGHDSEIQAIVDKCKPIMKKLGYGIHGVIDTAVKKNINFAIPINTNITILYNKDKKITKSLKEWLAITKNPKDETVTIDNKKVPAMSKKLYLTLLNQTVPLESLTTNPKDQKKLIDGAIMWHTARLLGNEILQNLTSEVGDVSKHEGIVIRDPKISKTPFKVVGEFIVQGMESTFGK